MIRWDWIPRNINQLTDGLVDHVVLTVIAVVIGLIISIGLSLAIYRWRGLFAPITGVAGILYTIPSLALFGLLTPWTGLSRTTAVIGLVTYTLLILTRNIVIGLDGVAPEVREAAAGMGFGPARRLFRIELPLALPVILAGIRVAVVTTIGLVTVTAYIGQGGLGRLILDGLTRDFRTPLVVGALLSVALAVVADVGLAALQRRLTPWGRDQ